ncbi:hypothetical protein, partial [Mycolicibacterium fortuitum]|uniref:hypothetical protein n=1 Tax=Mycolicibacterium fortuitum TaxID=1766 RepID=UPI001F3DA98C
YWVALDGARQALAARAKNSEGGQRCQAIAWFSDGKIDFTARDVAKPYAEGVDLSSQEGVDQARQRWPPSLFFARAARAWRAPSRATQ